jgi:nucleoside-diphosphate-sugar epimerase
MVIPSEQEWEATEQDNIVMRVLVTGCAGFVGSHLCEQLVDEGHEVVGVDAFIPYYAREIKETNLTNLHTSPSFQFHELDLRSDPLAPCLDGVDTVIHAAAMPGLQRSWTMFELYMTCNLLAVQRLLDASREADISKFLYISTSSVYGFEAVGDETQTCMPVSPYGVTKLAGENLVAAYVETYGFPASILRYFSIYGPRQRPDMAYNIFISSMMEGRPITVFGDGMQSRSNTFVNDCVQGTIQAVNGADVGEVYNIGGGRVLTLRKAIEIIADALDVSPHISYEPARIGDQRRTQADFSKAQRTFGFEPLTEPEEGLRAQIAWQSSRAMARD